MNKFEAWCKKQNLNFAEVGRRLGISRAHAGRLVRGVSKASDETKTKIVELTNGELSYGDIIALRHQSTPNST
jgi:transcriptional regulator with XRE-family HTH domain